jgi:hypothetical protein
LVLFCKQIQSVYPGKMRYAQNAYDRRQVFPELAMIALRKSRLWIGGFALLVIVGVLAWLWSARRSNTPASQITGAASATALESAGITSTRAPRIAAGVSATPEIPATRTPTFEPPPPTVLTLAATYAPTDLPPATLMAETQTGPGATRTFDLPPGLYRVVFRADAAFDRVTPVVEDGDCGSEPLLDGAPGPLEASAVYRSTGCRVHFEVDGAVGGWSLRVETAASSQSMAVPLSVQGSLPLATGEVDLPAGRYNVAVESQSPALVLTPLIVDGLCLERPILVLTAPGSYQAIYTSTGCRVVFQISAVTGPWRLVIKLKQ